MTFDLTRRGLIAGAAIAVPTLAFAQAKPQFAPIASILNGRVYRAGRAAQHLSRSRYPDPGSQRQ